MKASRWFVYIVENEKGHLYTGITTDPERRLKEHAEGKKGAKFFRTGGPVTIVFKKRAADRSSASKLEAKIKKLSREKKLALIASRKVPLC